MVRRLIEWSLNSPLVVILLSLVTAGMGAYAFIHINVEAYPDPAPAIIEVVAQWPGASAEEMERQVTIPLEITLAGMPGLKTTLSKSLFGLSHLRNVFHYGHDYDKARQEVINRLQFAQALPPGVAPIISPASPIGEIYRYTLKSPKNALGQDIYTLSDLKALQDWLLEREFRRVPRIIDVTSSGGTVKRYEIQPDPDRMKRFGITLQQLQTTLTNSNANVGGDFLILGRATQMVRTVGIIGGGKDPMEKAFGMGTAEEAAAYLRSEDQKRLREIRDIVITAVNNVPVRIDDVVDGGPLLYQDAPSTRGVVVSHQTRLGRISLDRALDAAGETWQRDAEKIQGIVLMRKGEESLPALEGVKLKVEELNKRGRLLPGVQIEPYYDRTELINVTTHTVRHNLTMGMVLVSVILLMFLSNVRSAVIVAINIPLALLIAFAMLYMRGKSANLLSIGAVDFGIIVDSAVIMVENIYRNLTSGANAELSLKQRILRASGEIDKALFFSTAIMVCAFLPLFTMTGSEGELFGPMAMTYAFALGGALLMALSLTPVLCLFLFKNLKPIQDNFLVRFLRTSYLRQLETCLKHRGTTLVVMGTLLLVTMLWPMRFLGREFMPELEEGNLWIRATFPVHVSLDGVTTPIRHARHIIGSSAYPEVQSVVIQSGRPDDGTDPGGYNNVELFVPMKPEKDWPVVNRPGGASMRRSRQDIIADMSAELASKLPGIEWSFSQYIRDNVMEAISGVKGDNSVKIYGPDLAKLEELAEGTKNILAQIHGLFDIGVFRIMGQSNLEFAVDKEKCKRWGVQVADVNNVIDSAVHGKALTQMVEGEKTFDITLRWPLQRRQDQLSILEIPVDIQNNQLTPGSQPGSQQTIVAGASTGPSSTGMSTANPALISAGVASYNLSLPRLRLRDLVSPVGEDGRPNPAANFVRPGGSMITRENGKRFIAVKFSVRDRDLASAVAEVQEKTKDLFQPPYRAAMGGEFVQMEDAEARLMIIIPVSLALICMLLYFAFRSLLDVAVILSNVLFSTIGGIWALYLTGTNFSISAAVGFISLFGVAIMDGLLLVSYFNGMRATGLPLREAIMRGAGMRVRPVFITDLTAILGLLPAALATEIGAQTQRPLAIVVVGGMLTTLFLTRYLLPVLYSFYGHREPPEGTSSMAH
ncbi:MAG TPA: efflux RND transporter permease subunit [Gemmataceae bacterium]|nr:efflux RND transporter permease subunit [Gemmataceae bacterium]